MDGQAEQWALIYEGFDPAQQGLREALSTLGNGYFATRGAAPDATADDVHYPGTYLAGGYNRLTTEIAGRQIENEDLVNLPNWLPLTFRIDGGPWLWLGAVEILDYRQVLDLRTGVLSRDLRLRDGQKRTTRWSERRLVSMAQKHLAGIELSLTAEDWSGRLEVRAGLDGSVTNSGVARYRALACRHLRTLATAFPGPDRLLLRSHMVTSGLEVAVAARFRLFEDGREVPVSREVSRDDDRVSLTLGCDVNEGRTIVAEKIVALHSGRDTASAGAGLEAAQSVERAPAFADLAADQALAWSQLWDDFDIEIDGRTDAATLGKLRLYLFHLLQTVSVHTADVDAGVPARGWHGEAYRGHVFWDEIFIFPLFTLRRPSLTRSLLLYRYRRLDAARRAARAAGFKGAMYPWQSGSNGREECQQVHLNPESGRWIPDNSHRQRHINVAIAYNVWKYYEVSDDTVFLHTYGAEMILEIARFWASAATFNPKLERYEIRGVMGPDEYHTAYPGTGPEDEAGIDNNAYTNVMAAWVMDRARDVLDRLPPLHRSALCARLGLGEDEIALWDEVARKLRVPFHDGGIISQFEGYDALEEFDWDGYRARYGNIQRLDRILEAEGDSVNRYKVSKQADVLMLFYLLSAEELGLLFEQLGYPFDNTTIPRNIDYYVARTSDGSTLSRVVHSWVLARSDRPRSWDLFQAALDSDVADIQGGTTPEGIHTGAMAGAVDLVQRCYVGLETRAGALHFNPALPADMGSLRARLRYRRHVLDVTVTDEVLRIASQPIAAAPITLVYRGHARAMAPGEAYEFRLLRPEDRNRDENRRTEMTGG